jgi:hypothetical protein
LQTRPLPLGSSGRVECMRKGVLVPMVLLLNFGWEGLQWFESSGNSSLDRCDPSGHFAESNRRINPTRRNIPPHKLTGPVPVQESVDWYYLELGRQLVRHDSTASKSQSVDWVHSVNVDAFGQCFLQLRQVATGTRRTAMHDSRALFSSFSGCCLSDRNCKS